MHGIPGGIVAGTFFVLPSVFVLLLLSYLSVAYTDVPIIRGLLYGVQPVVMAIVLDAVLRVGRRTLKHRVLYLFAAAAFVALFFLHLSFPLTIACAAAAGLLLQRWQPAVFRAGGEHHLDGASVTQADTSGHRSLAHALRVAGVFLVMWLVPVVALLMWRGWSDVLTQQMWFFTQAAFVTPAPAEHDLVPVHGCHHDRNARFALLMSVGSLAPPAASKTLSRRVPVKTPLSVP
jgi:chromate transporter